MITATVICDASFDPIRKFAGWAAWVKVDGVQNAVKGYGSIKTVLPLTSTTAKMYAALNGIWIAKQLGAIKILVRSDCLAVTQAVGGFGLGATTRNHWKAAYDSANLGNDLVLAAKHVKAHGEIKDAAAYVNDWCDRHAKLGMKAARRGKPMVRIV